MKQYKLYIQYPNISKGKMSSRAVTYDYGFIKEPTIKVDYFSLSSFQVEPLRKIKTKPYMHAVIYEGQNPLYAGYVTGDDSDDNNLQKITISPFLSYLNQDVYVIPQYNKDGNIDYFLTFRDFLTRPDDMKTQFYHWKDEDNFRKIKAPNPGRQKINFFNLLGKDENGAVTLDYTYNVKEAQIIIKPLNFKNRFVFLYLNLKSKIVLDYQKEMTKEIPPYFLQNESSDTVITPTNSRFQSKGWGTFTTIVSEAQERLNNIWVNYDKKTTAITVTTKRDYLIDSIKIGQTIAFSEGIEPIFAGEVTSYEIKGNTKILKVGDFSKPLTESL